MLRRVGLRLQNLGLSRCFTTWVTAMETARRAAEQEAMSQLRAEIETVKGTLAEKATVAEDLLKAAEVRLEVELATTRALSRKASSLERELELQQHQAAEHLRKHVESSAQVQGRAYRRTMEQLLAGLVFGFVVLAAIVLERPWLPPPTSRSTSPELELPAGTVAPTLALRKDFERRIKL